MRTKRYKDELGIKCEVDLNLGINSKWYNIFTEEETKDGVYTGYRHCADLTTLCEFIHPVTGIKTYSENTKPFGSIGPSGCRKYNDNGDLLVEYDPEDPTRYFNYDTCGNLVKVEYGGRIIMMEYDINGHMTRSTATEDDIAYDVVYVSDKNGNIVYSKASTGTSIHAEYTKSGKLLLYANSTYGYETRKYDTEDRLVEIDSCRRSLGGTDEYSFEKENRCNINIEWDVLGNLKSLERNGGEFKENYEYDEFNRCIKVNNTVYEYDKDDNCTYFNPSNGKWKRWTYDVNNNPISVKNSMGYWSKCEYNAQNQILNFECEKYKYEFRYDERGNKIYYGYDRKEIGCTSDVRRYRYNDDNEEIWIRYENSNGAISEYDRSVRVYHKDKKGVVKIDTRNKIGEHYERNR